MCRNWCQSIDLLHPILPSLKRSCALTAFPSLAHVPYRSLPEA